MMLMAPQMTISNSLAPLALIAVAAAIALIMVGAIPSLTGPSLNLMMKTENPLGAKL